MIMTDLKSNNGVVVVTGAASGIGKAIAEIYYSNGFNVVGLDLCDMRTDYPIIRCNVSDEESVQKAFNEISERYVTIRYLVNCAGIFFSNRRDRIERITLDEWNEVYKNNATSVMLVTKYAVPLMKLCNGDRAIISISSDQVKHPRQNNASYSVSKSALENYSRVCATELLNERIRVNVVEAASVRTNFIRKLAKTETRENEIYINEDSKMPLGLLYPDDIANMVFFLGSIKAQKITGQTILIDSGLYIKEEKKYE
jgi:short-chain dehydrogenase/reductase SDR